MPKVLFVGVIGDFNLSSETHTATNFAFSHSARYLKVEVGVEWIPTPDLEKNADDQLEKFDALLCAPGSPYKSMRGALNGIRFARENDRPFLGTCGGFQYVVIEYARDVMGIHMLSTPKSIPKHPISSSLLWPVLWWVESRRSSLFKVLVPLESMEVRRLRSASSVNTA